MMVEIIEVIAFADWPATLLAYSAVGAAKVGSNSSTMCMNSSS